MLKALASMQFRPKILSGFLYMLLILINFITSSCAQIQGRYHQVVRGETLGLIAQRYSIPVSELKDHNDVDSGLHPGAKLFIPFEESATWNPTPSSSFSRSKWYSGRKMKAVDYDVSDAPNALPSFVWPVIGYISSGFGVRRGSMHDGIDVVAPTGTPVKAARSGHVIYANNRIGGYGNMVIVRHPDSYSTVYAHLSKVNVRKGQFINKGFILGKVGQTGSAEGPHLHFEVRNHRQPVDPLLYLQVKVAANILRR